MTNQTLEKFRQFVDIVQRLRKECPWDSTQTHDSLKHLMIEEVYEAVEAIDQNDFGELKKELGDMLLHVVLHSIMAEETQSFNLDEVLDSISKKLIVRHPHIFSDEKVESVGEVLGNWEKLKMKEGRQSILEGVPNHLPALLQAYRIQDKVSNVGFDWQKKEDVWEKVKEEIFEFEPYRLTNSEEKINEFGDLLFSLVNYARHIGIHPEEALAKSNKKFKRRFQFVEQRMKETGKEWVDTSLEQMDEFWNEAKESEKKKS